MIAGEGIKKEKEEEKVKRKTKAKERWEGLNYGLQPYTVH